MSLGKRFHLGRRQKRRVSTAANVPVGLKTYNLRSKDREKVASQRTDRECQAVEQYSPLDQHTQEIRVLILQPGVGIDRIHCTLETYHLQGCKPYEALSYAWGDPKPVESIYINGSRTLIAHNLSVALQHLRFSKSCRTLWIDAIRINQTDVGERNHQVYTMNLLYSAAERVLVWLGEARNSSDIAMRKLLELAERRETTFDAKAASMSLIYDCLIDRNWWGRLWVVQEVVLAKKDPIMICGSSSLPWSTFVKGCIASGLDKPGLPEHGGRNVERLSQFDALKNLRGLYQSQIISNKGCRLSSILRSTKDSYAADPRDKVYGTLGLLCTTDRDKLKPDYKKSVELVFLEATQYILKHEADHYISFFSRFSLATNLKTLSRASPSWIPDFSAQKTISPCNPSLMTRAPGHIYEKLFLEAEKDVSFQDHNRFLACPGVLVDAIEIVAELKDNEKLLLDQIPGLEHLIQLAVGKVIPADDPRYYFSKFKKCEDIFQLLTGGRNNMLEPSFRCQYNVLTSQAGSSILGSQTPREFSSGLIWLLQHVLLGRCFFISKMGFFGLAVTRVRKNDFVTFLFGNHLPMMLRPRGLSYCMVSAANVSGLTHDEVTGGINEKGPLEERTFLIR